MKRMCREMYTYASRRYSEPFSHGYAEGGYITPRTGQVRNDTGEPERVYLLDDFPWQP
jgi:hypothetical protein